jgi:hypothetical protein
MAHFLLCQGEHVAPVQRKCQDIGRRHRPIEQETWPLLQSDVGLHYVTAFVCACKPLHRISPGLPLFSSLFPDS